MSILCAISMRLFPLPVIRLKQLHIANCLLAVCFLPVVLQRQSMTCDWQEFLLGDPELSIEMPAEMVPMEVQVPFDMINHIKRFDTYRLYFAEGKVVAVVKFAEYNIPIAKNAHDVMQDELNGILKGLKAMNIQRDETDIKLKGIRGNKVEGSFELNDSNWSFEDQLFVRDGAMWQVWMGIEKGDEDREEIMRKVMKSLKFKL